MNTPTQCPTCGELGLERHYKDGQVVWLHEVLPRGPLPTYRACYIKDALPRAPDGTPSFGNKTRKRRKRKTDGKNLLKPS